MNIHLRSLSALVHDVGGIEDRTTQAGEWVRLCRVDQDLTQTALAKRLNVSQACLSHLESGARTWTPGMLRRVVVALAEGEVAS